MRRRGLVMLVLLIAALGLAGQGFSQETADRACQIRAAEADAIARLRQQVLRQHINRAVTVGDLITRTNSLETLDRALQHAELLGGPRWLDPQTCQVQMRISGARIAGALQQIVAGNPRMSPVRLEEMQLLGALWQRYAFQSTGASTLSPPAQGDPRMAAGPWAGVNQEIRQKVYAAAHQEAIARLEEAVSVIRLNDRVTIGDALRDPIIRKSFEDWLARRPITRVNLREDLQMEVALGVTGGEVYEFLHALLKDRPEMALPGDQAGAGRIKQAFAAGIGPAIGCASAGGPQAPQPATSPVSGSAIGQPAPSWATDEIDVTGVCQPVHGSRLLARREAEQAAMQRLQARLNDLPLEDKVTLGHAAAADPHMAACMARAMASAKVVRTEYHADGSVAVKVVLNLRALWSDLHPVR